MTVFLWLFIFIHFVQLPAMIIILLKIIVWDNIVSPSLGRQEAVAHTAHLAGYFFGFAGALVMLFVRAVPRDQFDILALWKRWHQRRQLATALSDPAAAARARYGTVAEVAAADPRQRASEERRLDQITELRGRIGEEFERRDVSAAVATYEELVALDPKQCLSERDQLEMARAFYSARRFPEAATAFERFVDCYARSTEASNVRLLLGIIYARDLGQYDLAERHLTESMGVLRDETRRDQCREWLRNVRTLLGRPASDV